MASEFRVRAVVAVERPGSHRVVHLRTVGRQLRLVFVEHFFGRAVRVVPSFDHQRWNRVDEHGFGRSALAVPGQVADHFTAAGRMAHVNGVLEVQLLGQRREVVGVVVHVVALGGVAGTPVPAPVVRDDPVTLLQEEQHLVVPVVGRQRPAVAEHDRLARSPVLVVDLGSVRCGDCAHLIPALESAEELLGDPARGQDRRNTTHLPGD